MHLAAIMRAFTSTNATNLMLLPLVLNTTAMSRGSISISEPISWVKDRAEGPDLRIAKRGWWSLFEGGEKQKKKKLRKFRRSSGREGKRWGFFVLSAPKIEDARVLVLRTRKIDLLPCSKNPPIFEEFVLPRLLSDLRPIIRDRRSQMGAGSSTFGLDRRLKMRKIMRSSAPKIEDEGFFDLRDRKVEEPSHLRCSKSKDRRTLLYSIFDLRLSKIDEFLLSSIFATEDWLEDRHRFHGNCYTSHYSERAFYFKIKIKYLTSTS